MLRGALPSLLRPLFFTTLPCLDWRTRSCRHNLPRSSLGSLQQSSLLASNTSAQPSPYCACQYSAGSHCPRKLCPLPACCQRQTTTNARLLVPSSLLNFGRRHRGYAFAILGLRAACCRQADPDPWQGPACWRALAAPPSCEHCCSRFLT